MPENFKCNVCYKAFKTNQHLTQHKNRKKKCHAPLPDMDNYSVASSVTTTPLFNFPIQNYHCQSLAKSQTPTLDNLDENHNSIFCNKQELHFMECTPPLIQNISNQAVMDLFVKYKETLDENKKLENNIVDLKTQLINLNAERTLLKKKIDMVDKFIFSFQDFPCIQNLDIMKNN